MRSLPERATEFPVDALLIASTHRGTDDQKHAQKHPTGPTFACLLLYYRLLSPIIPVQRPKPNRLAQVLRRNTLRPIQVRNRPRRLQEPVMRPL